MMRTILLATLLTVPLLPAMAQEEHHHAGPVSAATDPPIKITINPEVRVSVIRGGALPPPGACGQELELPVKIVNEGFLTSPLEARLVDFIPAGVSIRFGAEPLKGSREELRTLLVRLEHPGPVDITVAFKARNDIPDLGGRDRVHLLLRCGQGTWIGTWATSPVGLPTIEKFGPYAIPAPIEVKGTIRYRLRVSQGGDRIGLRLSNEYGKTPLALAAVTVGLAAEGLEARPGSLKKALFGGKPNIVIPAGAPAITDPVDLPVGPLGDLVVSIYVPEGISVFAWPKEKPVPIDPGVAIDADASLLEHFPVSKQLWVRPVVSAVNVSSDRARKVVVTLGDSITDGSTDPSTGERGWPGALSRRLQGKNISVVNAGIGGNRLLQSMDYMGRSALARVDQDVFSVPGVTHMIVLEGVNDIGVSGKGNPLGDSPLVQPEELIAVYSQLIARAHERGIEIIGATILPFEGALYYSEEKEKVRTAVNEWIRSSGAFDGVIDFDAAMRDPAQPRRLKAEYDPGDHLHPNYSGYRRMGEIIDLKLFD